MTDDDKATRRMILEAGGLVILHPDGPAGGFPLVVPVDQISDGKHWFLGSCDPIERGEILIVEMPVAMDARYVTQGRVVAKSPETFALAIKPEWERVQARAFVRITAHGLQVRVVRLNATQLEEEDPDATDNIHDLLDISAGGVRFESDTEYETGEEVICHFELPGSLCFVLPARIVRNADRFVPASAKPGIAVEFVGLDENTRSQLLRWVYREQVRRHRNDLREGDDA